MKKTSLQKNSFWENNKFILLAGGCALLIMVLIFYCYDLLPFGNMTILRMDLYHQYGPLFAELYDRITSGDSLLYSWESGLGGSFLGNFLNYLSSPLSFLILFFGHKNITEAISFMILLKATLASMTFAYYLKESHRRNDASIAAFGTLYAFCGYFVAYYWNLMWIDAMYLFPLVILGIEKIINKGKPTLYCISLAVLFLANYYMAYMVCIFSVLYFLAYYFGHYSITQKFQESAGENLKKPSLLKRMKNSLFLCAGTKFALYSILSVLIVAVCILPLLEILSGSSATNGTAPTELKKYFTAFDFLANHIAYSSPTIRSSGTEVLPNVYCGILTLILVPLYLFCDKISSREKIANVVLLGVLYFSFNINYLNYFWHGFHFPNDLPYRFSFMYSFVLLQLAFKAFMHIKDIKGKHILASGIGLVAFLVLVEEITSKNITDISLLLTLVFAAAYVLILHNFKNKRFTVATMSFLLMCTSVSEIALSNTNQYTMNQNKENYTADYENFRALKENLDKHDASPFYRMELTNLRTRMDPSWYNYNGISVFSSMANEKVANLQNKLGIAGNYINSYTYHLQTPVYNAMFGLKYIVNNDNSTMNPELYTELFSSDKFTAFENKYALPMAFTCDANVSEWIATEYNNPFESQSDWFKFATGVDHVFKRVPIANVDYNNVTPFLPKDIESGNMSFAKENEEADASFSVSLETFNEENLYLYIKSAHTGDAEITANLFSKTMSTKDGYILDLGTHGNGEMITITLPIKEDESRGNVEIYAYTLDMSAFQKGYQILSEGALEIAEFKETYVKGKLFSQNNQILYTSIPYDKNWTVYVDGLQVNQENIFALSDGLLALKIGPGSHTVEFKYQSKGLLLGACISLVALLLFLFLTILQKKKKTAIQKWQYLESNVEASAVTPPTDNMISDYLDLDIIVEDKKKE